jgi:hypothetical protein
MNRYPALLKLIPALAALGFSLTVACASAVAAPPAAKKDGKAITFYTVLQRSVPGQTGGEVRTIARDPDTWKALWASLRQNGGDSLPPDPPAVNFPREMALVVAMPTQSCVSQVTIQSIAHLGSPTNGTLLVTLLEAPAAPNCKCIVSSRPIHVVRLPRTGGILRFAVNHGQTACGGSPAPH